MKGKKSLIFIGRYLLITNKLFPDITSRWQYCIINLNRHELLIFCIYLACHVMKCIVIFENLKTSF